jgi:membrane protease subunit HflC
MRNGIAGGVLVVIALFAVIVAYGSLYTVQQTQQALVVQLGKPVRVVTEPGLHAKVPLVESVVTFDKRILDLEAAPQELIASDQKRLVVDAFARYRIIDVLKFYQTLGTIEGAKIQLGNLMSSSLRRVIGDASFLDVVKDKRDQLMARIREQVDRDADIYGVSVVDVRIRRADLPEANSQAVYERMKTDRQREAAGFRAAGQQEAQQTRARADRDVTVLVAEAQSKGEQTRGEGDAERNRIFAEAYNRDKDFFAFYRSMQAYETALQHNDTRMLLKPDSQFFRFFVAPDGKNGSAVQAAPSPQPGAAQTQGSAR